MAADRPPPDAWDQFLVSMMGADNLHEVCQAISGQAGSLVGASFVQVIVAGAQSRLARMFPPPESGPATVPLDAAHPAIDAMRFGSPVSVDDLREPPGRYPLLGADVTDSCDRVVAYPLDSDLVRAAIMFGWTADVDVGTHPVGRIIRLAGAAIARAWTADEARALGAITQALSQHAPLGFAYLDRDMRYVLANDRLAEMNGLPAGDHIGKTMREVVPDLVDSAEDAIRSVLETGRPTERIEVTGHTPADPDSQRIWEEVFVPVVLPSDEIIGVAVIVEDVTERRTRHALLERDYSLERATALRLQRELLPSHLETPPGYLAAGRYLPGTDGLSVGGDWYELSRLDDDLYAIAMGDVAGHGIDAAIQMGRIRYSIARLAPRFRSPGWMLEDLRKLMVEENAPDSYIATLFFGVIQPSTGRLEYASAGHLAPLVIHEDGMVAPLESGTGPPLGVHGIVETFSLHLEVGSTLLLFTDGLVERRTDDIDAGLRRLVVAAGKNDLDLDRYVTAILAETLETDHDDDVALLVIRRTE